MSATKHVAKATDAKDFCFYKDQRELSHLGFNAPGWAGKDGKRLQTDLMVMFNMPISRKYQQLYHWTCCGSKMPSYRTARIYLPAGLFHNVRSGYVQKLKNASASEMAEVNDGGLHQAMSHYLHRYAYNYVESGPDQLDAKSTVITANGELLHAMGLNGILPLAMAQVISKDDQMGDSFTYSEMFKWHALGIRPNPNYTDFGCKASVWKVDEYGSPIEEIGELEGTQTVDLSGLHYFKNARGEPCWDPNLFERTELQPCSHQLVDLTTRFSSFAFTRELTDGAVLYRAQHPGMLSVLYQTNGNVSFIEWEKAEVLTTLIGPDLVDVHVHARNYQSICQALITRVAKAEEEKQKRALEYPTKKMASNSEKALMKRFVQQICDIAFQRKDLLEWRNNNSLCEMLKSPNMDVKTFRSEVEKMWGKQVLTYIDNYTAQIKVEVNPSNPEKKKTGSPAPEDKPRIYISVKEQAIIASLLVIKCFEDIWFGHDPRSKYDVKFDQDYWGAQKVIYRATEVEFKMQDHIKHVRREEALRQHIERSRKLRLPRSCFGVEGDGSSWDWTISHEIREHTENIILDKITRVLTELWCFDVPCEAIQTQMKDRHAKTAKMKVSTKDREERAKYYVWANNKAAHDEFVVKSVKLIADTVRWSGERGTSSLNHFVNHVFWSYVLFKNPIEPYLRATQDGWMELNIRDASGNPAHETRARTLWGRQSKGVEGDDSALTLEIAVCDTPVYYLYAIDAVHGKKNGGIVHQPGRHTNERMRLLDPTDDKDWELIENSFFKKVRDLWEAWGFMMKLVFARPGQTMVFIGANFLMTKEGLGMCYVPEILRGIASASWSVSREILVHGINSKEGALAAYASHTSRAVAMPNIGTANIVREYYKANANGYVLSNHKKGVSGTTDYVCKDRDLARKFGVDPGTAINIYAEVERSSHYYSWMNTEDVDRLVALTCGKVTEKEYLSGTSWGVLTRDSIGVLDRFPATWREKIRARENLYQWEPEAPKELLG